MEIKNLNKKVSEKIYVVDVENVCDSTRGYYTTKSEAINKAKKENETTNNNVSVNILKWDNEEKKYKHQYENNALIPAVYYI